MQKIVCHCWMKMLMAVWVLVVWSIAMRHVNHADKNQKLQITNWDIQAKIPTPLLIPMRILAYRGAMSRWFTLIPEMAKPEKPTAMMRHVTAVASGVVILIMVHQVRLMMFLLKMVDYSMCFLLLSIWNFFWWTSRVDNSETFLLSKLFGGTPHSC